LGTSGDAGNPQLAHTLYDAPEIATTVSPAADVWSLGVTLVDALTQTPPGWQVSDQTEPVLPESMPGPFRSLARDCLRLDPARRCTLPSIEARLEGKMSSAPTPKTGKPVSPRSGMMLVIAIVLIALVVFALDMRF